MRILDVSVLGLTMAVALTASAATADEPADQPLLREVASQVDGDALHQTIAKLVAFGTRHTMSDTRSATRGIGDAG